MTKLDFFRSTAAFFASISLFTGLAIGQTFQSLHPSKTLSRGAVRNVQMTSDGRFSLAFAYQSLHVWRNSDRKDIFSLSEQRELQAASLASIEGGCLLALVRQNSDYQKPSLLEIRDLTGESKTRTIPIAPLTQSTTVSFGPQNKHLAIVDGYQNERTLYVVDLSEGKVTQTVRPFDKDFRQAEFVPNSTHMILAGNDSSGVSLKIWDWKTGETISENQWQKGVVCRIAVNQSGTQVASLSTNETISLFQVDDGQLKLAKTLKVNAYGNEGVYDGTDRKFGLFYTEDDSRIWYLNHSYGEVLSWDADTLELVVSDDWSWADSAMPSNDDRAIFADHKGKLFLADLTNMRRLERPPLWRKTKNDGRSCFGALQNKIVVGRDSSYGPFRILEPATGNVISQTPRFSRFRPKFAGVNSFYMHENDELRKYDLSNHSISSVAMLKKSDELESVAELPDGTLALATQSDRKHFFRVIDGQGQLVFDKELEGNDDCSRIVLSPNGRYACLTFRDDSVLWDLEDDLELSRFKGGYVVGFTPDSATLVTNGGTTLMDLHSGKIEKPFPVWQENYHWKFLRGNYLISCRSEMIQVWDVKKGELVGTIGLEINKRLSFAGVSPDGKYALVRFDNREQELAAWDLSEWVRNANSQSTKDKPKPQSEWPSIPRSFTSENGIEIIVSPEQPVSSIEIEKALRSVLRQVQAERLDSKNSDSSGGSK